MDERQSDLKDALHGPAAGPAEGIGPHPGWKRLLAYREGTVEAAEREAVQEHLSLCRRCTGLLRELVDFEADATAGAAVPSAEREQAWNALLERLPAASTRSAESASRAPAAGRANREPLAPRQPQNFAPWLGYAAAIALLLVTVGLAAWTATRVRQERRHVADLEQRLVERQQGLLALEQSLDEARRQLEAANEQLRLLELEAADRAPERGNELAARVAELSAEVERLRRQRGPATDDRPRLAAHQVEVSVAPRFALREPGRPAIPFLNPDASNAVRLPAVAEPLTLLLDLSSSPTFAEYRLELLDASGNIAWTARRPAGSLLGDAGTTLSLRGLTPGSYSLRIEGARPDGTSLLADYALEIKP